MAQLAENSSYFTFVRISKPAEKGEQQLRRIRDYTMKYHLDENYSSLEKKEILKPAGNIETSWKYWQSGLREVEQQQRRIATANEQQTSNLGLVQNVIKVSQFRNTTTKSIFCNC